MPTAVQLLSTVPAVAKNNPLVIIECTKTDEEGKEFRSVNLKKYDIPRECATYFGREVNHLLVVCNDVACDRRKNAIEKLNKKDDGASLYRIREGYQGFARNHKHWKDEIKKNGPLTASIIEAHLTVVGSYSVTGSYQEPAEEPDADEEEAKEQRRKRRRQTKRNTFKGNITALNVYVDRETMVYRTEVSAPVNPQEQRASDASDINPPERRIMGIDDINPQERDIIPMEMDAPPPPEQIQPPLPPQQREEDEPEQIQPPLPPLPPPPPQPGAADHQMNPNAHQRQIIISMHFFKSLLH
eukprot:145604_1